MKLCIKQRVFSWGDTYDVYDEWGNVRYVIKPQFFPIGHQLHVFEKSRRIGKLAPFISISLLSRLVLTS